MKKTFLFGFALSAISISSFAQTDTLFVNNQKIACVVKELTTDAVRYSYPNEDLVNTVYKNTVNKIIFKSGRVQTFAEATSFKKVNSAYDYENVTITGVESEVKGLYKLGEVSSKAVGTTALANQERVKDRAYRKMKLQAAMMGGNIVYLTAQRTQGNVYGTEYQAASPTETNLTGICYTSTLSSLEDLKKAIADRKEFGTFERFKLGGSDSNIKREEVYLNFSLKEIHDNNGIITLEGNLDGLTKVNKFLLAGITADHISIFYRDKSTVYSYSLKL